MSKWILSAQKHWKSTYLFSLCCDIMTWPLLTSQCRHKAVEKPQTSAGEWMSLIDDFQAWLSGQMNGSLNSPQQSPAMAYGANGKKNAFDFSFSNPFKSFIYLEDMFFFLFVSLIQGIWANRQNNSMNREFKLLMLIRQIRLGIMSWLVGLGAVRVV